MTVETPMRPAPALARRLGRVGGVLDPQGLAPEPDEDSLFETLALLVSKVSLSAESGPVWLLLVALTGAMPDPSLVHAVRRGLAIRTPEVAVPWLLALTTSFAGKHGTPGADLRLVTDRPLVDVDLTAQTDFVTGIQRVVRGVARRWAEQHDLELVVWGAREGAYRSLSASERARLVEEAEVGAFVGHRTPVAEAGADTEIVVPWGVPVLVTEVPMGRRNDRLAALAEFTHSSVRLVGYDCIPAASPETVNGEEMEKFGRYLELVKHADRLAAISHTTAHEFEGFNRALSAQGLTGPEVVACPLPHTISPIATPPALPPPDRPVVVTVGSLGRRKNQVAVVEAAELLWRDGVDFELRLLGHQLPERSPLWELIRELQKIGRALTVEKGVSDARIAESLAQARCLVFPSLHEGFGLPVVEALTQLVPVITSDFGSLRELAEDQGGVLVNPEDIDQLAAAIRAVVTDDALHARLVAEAAARPVRTWSDYADELWEVLRT